MKKTLLAIGAIMCMLNIARSQTSGGPDVYGYIWKDSFDPAGPTYNWIDIIPLPNAQEVYLLADDNTCGPFTLNQPFHFYWNDITTLWVGSNGYIAFDSSDNQLSSPFPMIPDTSVPQNFIAAMESDLNFSGAGNPSHCWYWSNSNNDTLIVSWLQVPFWQDPSSNPTPYTGSNSFQIILSNTDSSITMQYMEQNGFTYTSFGVSWMSIGIENNSGLIGLQHSHNAYPPINYAIKYYYPATTFPGIDENDKIKDLSVVYPNPATDFVSVDYELNEPVNRASYTVYNLQGKKIAEKIINHFLNDKGVLKIDVSNLTNGLHICKLKLNDHEFIRRINVIK